MGFAVFQPNCIYGHRNLHFILFSWVIKHSSFDFVFSQPFKNVQTILMSQAIWKQAAGQIWPINALLTLDQRDEKQLKQRHLERNWNRDVIFSAIFTLYLFQSQKHCLSFVFISLEWNVVQLQNLVQPPCWASCVALGSSLNPKPQLPHCNNSSYLTGLVL